MGSLVNTLFRIMLSWLQGVVSSVWTALTSEKGGTFLDWIGNNWIPIAVILCVIGLAADLCVYLFRWKPLRVWKSFFNRRSQKDDPAYDDIQPPFSENRSFVSKQPVVPRPEPKQEAQTVPDFSRWEMPSETATEPAQQEILPPTVTGAGYVVPADSPYRRPKEEAVLSDELPEEPLSESRTEEETYKPVPIRTRRKRRLNVSDLFSNPEEELYDFDAPQQVIDSRKAYHEPVYPRDWKKSEDKVQ